MPFTLAHPLAVVPLRRTPLPFAALAIGAMAPDTGLFVPLPFGIERATTHTLLAALTLDVVIGAVLWTVWELLLRRPLADGAPPWVRARLDPDQSPWLPRRAGELARLVLALAIGSVTHVVWDAFTHIDGWVVERWAPLRQQVGGMEIWHLLQWVCGALGFSALVVIAFLALRRRRPIRRARVHPWVGPAAVIAPIAAGALAAGAVGAAALGSPAIHTFERGAYYTVRAGIAAAGAVLLTVAALWHLLPAKAPSTIEE